MADTELPDALPESWIEDVEFQIRAAVPVTFTEDRHDEAREDSETRGVIHLVRQTIFPRLGLEP
jgi:hypothetical protein